MVPHDFFFPFFPALDRFMRQSHVTVSAINIPGLQNTGLRAKSTMSWDRPAVEEERNLEESGVWRWGERAFVPFIKTPVLLSRYLMISVLCPLTVCNFKNPWKQLYSLSCEHGRASAAHHPQSLLFPNYTGQSTARNRSVPVHQLPAITANKTRGSHCFAMADFSAVVSIFGGFSSIWGCHYITLKRLT